MPLRDQDDWDDADEDEDVEEDSSDDWVCPDCGAEVYEDCEQCPSCGNYITPRSKSTFEPSGRWMIMAVLMMLAAIGIAVVMFR